MTSCCNIILSVFQNLQQISGLRTRRYNYLYLNFLVLPSSYWKVSEISIYHGLIVLGSVVE